MALAVACKDYIDSKVRTITRFEDLGLTETSELALPQEAASLRRFVSTDATVSIGVRNVRITEGNFGYRSERQMIESCSIRFTVKSMEDSDLLRGKISAFIGKDWKIYRGHYRIDYSKKRLAQFITSFGDFRTDISFGKAIK